MQFDTSMASGQISLFEKQISMFYNKTYLFMVNVSVIRDNILLFISYKAFEKSTVKLIILN